MLRHLQHRLVRPNEFQHPILMLQQPLSLRRQMREIILKCDQAGLHQIIQQRVEHLYCHARPRGEYQHVEPLAILRFLLQHGVKHPGMTQRPPRDQGEVPGDELLGGLLGDFARGRKHTGTPLSD